MITDFDIEKFMSLCKGRYQQEDVTAEVEVIFGYVDYTEHPVIADYEDRGYILHDTFTFGHGEQWGEVLIFVKDKRIV